MAQPAPDLGRALLDGARACVRPPVGRFRHPWLAPMPPPSAGAEAADGFVDGDYSLGLFHHDVSEAAIELVGHEDLREACLGSLLCFLDLQAPDGRVHRVETPWRPREVEPAKPVIGQLALRCVQAGGDAALERLDHAGALPKLLAWVAFLERTAFGPHGLGLAWSALQSGFDNDLLTSGQPDLSVETPDASTFLVLELEALAALFRHVGRDDLAAPLEDRAARLRWLIEALLWREDEQGGLYVGLRWRRGSVAPDDLVVAEPDGLGRRRPLDSWVGLLPLYAAVPSPDRAEALIRRLVRPEGYWGPRGVRTVPADSPWFQQAPRALAYDPKKAGRGPVSNWSGPVWVLPQAYLAAGLARYGRRDLAAELARRTWSLLAHDLAATGRLHECYDDAGRGLWPRRGTFVSWNVLALTLRREHLADAG